MNCPSCSTNSPKPHGVFGKRRIQRFRCCNCKRTFSERSYKPIPQSNVDTETLLRVIHCLVEGVSVRGTERLTGVHRDTILKLLVIAGEKCERLMGTKVRNVPVADIQCDEIWGYVGKKEQNKWMDESHRKDLGDAYTFVAIERDSKLVLAFHLGRRDQRSTDQFIDKLRTATAPNRFQITTDGFATYTTAIDTALFDRCDYAQLVKVYASPREGEARYSTADVVGAVPTPIMGNPDSDRICTSHVERNNLTMRMQLRRLTRLTNGFSKKWANLRAALSLYFGYYNFCRVHSTIRCTPAMEAGITDHIWTLAELLSYHTT